ncbi:Uncharacterised protein [Mycobacteroides abscessus subsp. abscessus]|nr:Uncharacterised protein [Mycobacteroides abscessus subsp. abscessus]
MHKHALVGVDTVYLRELGLLQPSGGGDDVPAGDHATALQCEHPDILGLIEILAHHPCVESNLAAQLMLVDEFVGVLLKLVSGREEL